MFFCQWTSNSCFQWKLSRTTKTRPTAASPSSLFSSKSNLRLVFVPRLLNGLSTHQSRFSSDRFLQTHFNGETGNDGFNERRPLLRRASSSTSSSSLLTSDPRLFSLKVLREKSWAIWNPDEASFSSCSISTVQSQVSTASEHIILLFQLNSTGHRLESETDFLCFSLGLFSWGMESSHNWSLSLLREPHQLFQIHASSSFLSLPLLSHGLSLHGTRGRRTGGNKKTAPTEKGRLGRPLGDERERFQLSIKGALPWELFIVDMCVVKSHTHARTHALLMPMTANMERAVVEETERKTVLLRAYVWTCVCVRANEIEGAVLNMVTFLSLSPTLSHSPTWKCTHAHTLRGRHTCFTFSYT